MVSITKVGYGVGHGKYHTTESSIHTTESSTRRSPRRRFVTLAGPIVNQVRKECIQRFTNARQQTRNRQYLWIDGAGVAGLWQ
jgi:hypothetical protein